MQVVSRVTRGWCGCLSLPCKGRSLAGWQFMQRGCVSTLAASANIARDRSAGSEIDANAEGACKPLGAGVCAEPATEPASAAQHNKAGNDNKRMMAVPRSRRQPFPAAKVHFVDADLRHREGELGFKPFDRWTCCVGEAAGTRRVPCRAKCRVSGLMQAVVQAASVSQGEPIRAAAIVVSGKSGQHCCVLRCLAGFMQGGLHA